MKKIISAGLGALLLVFIIGGSAQAQTLFGGATTSSDYVTLVSNTGDATTTNDFSGISFEVASGTTFSTLTTLSVDYNVTDTDCKAGSPRFAISLDTASGTKNIFAYIGPEPSYNGCAMNTWASSTNLLSGTRFVDTSQLPGGTFYDTLAHATSTYGTLPVTGIELVVDSGWAFASSTQTVLVDNVMINGTLTTFNSTSTGTTTATTTPDTTAPPVPTHLSPANGSTLTSAAFTMADWTDVVDASSSPVAYIYESSTASSTNFDGSFSTASFTSGLLTESQISTAGTPEGTYYWHVRAVDAVGNMSAWSSAWSVTVSNATSTPPTPPPGPTDKDQCKDGGWKTFTNPSFKNQGQCVSTMAKQQR